MPGMAAQGWQCQRWHHRGGSAGGGSARGVSAGVSAQGWQCRGGSAGVTAGWGGARGCPPGWQRQEKLSQSSLQKLWGGQGPESQGSGRAQPPSTFTRAACARLSATALPGPSPTRTPCGTNTLSRPQCHPGTLPPTLSHPCAPLPIALSPCPGHRGTSWCPHGPMSLCPYLPLCPQGLCPYPRPPPTPHVPLSHVPMQCPQCHHPCVRALLCQVHVPKSYTMSLSPYSAVPLPPPLCPPAPQPCARMSHVSMPRAHVPVPVPMSPTTGPCPHILCHVPKPCAPVPKPCAHTCHLHHAHIPVPCPPAPLPPCARVPMPVPGGTHGSPAPRCPRRLAAPPRSASAAAVPAAPRPHPPPPVGTARWQGALGHPCVPWWHPQGEQGRVPASCLSFPRSSWAPTYLVAAVVEGEEEEGGGGGTAGGCPQLQLKVVPVAVVDLGVGQPQPGQLRPPLPDVGLRLPLVQLRRGTSVPPPCPHPWGGGGTPGTADPPSAPSG